MSSSSNVKVNDMKESSNDDFIIQICLYLPNNNNFLGWQKFDDNPIASWQLLMTFYFVYVHALYNFTISIHIFVNNKCLTHGKTWQPWGWRKLSHTKICRKKWGAGGYSKSGIGHFEFLGIWDFNFHSLGFGIGVL